MNKIKASIDQSDYGEHYDFLNFRIDGYWLDEKIDELYPGHSYKGLVPTLSFWLYKEEEKEIVWSRILPEPGEKTICPILMCPDDCDFSCTLLVAEIENWGNTIRWNRLGLDTTASYVPEETGSKVEWFYKIGALEFDETDYLQMVQTFKKQYDEDEKTQEA